MIKVYFEYHPTLYAEEVAQFENEEVYEACFPILEKLAKEANMCVTDSVIDEEDKNKLFKWEWKL